MAPKVAASRGVPATDSFAFDLVWARVRGEQIARDRTLTEDVSLEAIWREATTLLGWSFSEDLLAAELEAERGTLFPIGDTFEQVRIARSGGKRVLFISDTYLPGAFLEGILREAGFFQDGDRLYASGEIGLRKGTGNLFRHVLEQEGVSSGGLHHTGDHRESDVAPPISLGASARHTEASALSPAERMLADAESYAGNVGKWAAAMRMSRIHRDAAELGGNLTFVSQFLGPFLLSFVAWVLRTAQLKGLKRLYFASRDCQLAAEVAQLLTPDFGSVDCRYLHISRQSLLLPTLRSVSREDLPWLRRGYARNDLAGVLSKLEVAYADTEAIWTGLGERQGSEGADFLLQTEQDWERFWRIFEESAVPDQVLRTAALRREAALDYLRDQGLFDDVKIGLVDLGWSLTSQRALNHLLVNEGRKSEPVAGLYLQYLLQRPPHPDTGSVHVLFPPLPFDRRRTFDHLLPHDYATLLEHTVGLSDHESVHHYETVGDRAIPFGSSGPLKRRTKGLFAPVHHGVVGFAEAHRELAARPESVDTTSTQQRLQLLMKAALRNPSLAIVNEMESIRWSQDQNHRFPQPLTRPLTVWNELPSGLPGIRRFQTPPPVWPEGSLLRTGAGSLAAIRIIGALKGSLPTGVKSNLKRLLGTDS